MYERLKAVLLPLFKVEQAGPLAPAGHGADEIIQIFRASSRYLAYRLFAWKIYAVLWMAAALAVAIVLVATRPSLILLAAPLVVFACAKAALFYVVTRLGYEMRWYVVTDRSLLIRHGVWVVREITLTFANAQNVRVTQGPLERLFGFSNVEIDTAGGGDASKEKPGIHAHRAVLRGLEDPERVRNMILAHLRQRGRSGLGDEDEDHARTLPMLNGELLAEILAEAKKLRATLRKAGFVRQP